MALFDIFMSSGIDEMINEGQSMRSIARYLRDSGLHFSDSSLRQFRDLIQGDATLNLSHFGKETAIPEEFFTPSDKVPCGEYGIAVTVRGFDTAKNRETTYRSFERIDSFTTKQAFLNQYRTAISDRVKSMYGIDASDMEIEEGYIGEC